MIQKAQIKIDKHPIDLFDVLLGCFFLNIPETC